MIEAVQGIVLRPVAHPLHPIDEGRHSEEGPLGMGLLKGHALDARLQSPNGIVSNLYGIIGKNRSVKAVVYGPPLAARSSRQPPHQDLPPGHDKQGECRDA